MQSTGDDASMRGSAAFEEHPGSMVGKGTRQQKDVAPPPPTTPTGSLARRGKAEKGGFLKSGEAVEGNGDLLYEIPLLKKGGGTSVFGRQNWLQRTFRLHSNVLSYVVLLSRVPQSPLIELLIQSTPNAPLFIPCCAGGTMGIA